jgi:uncharacterized repeat protein (TIGR03803 family)
LGGGRGCEDRDGCGTVFKLATDGSESVLHAFIAGDDGAYPSAGLILDESGNLYGTTTAGGDFSGSAGPCFWNGNRQCGTVFELSPNGTLKVLHAFPSDGNEGGESFAGLIADKSRNLYGTTAYGDHSGCDYGCGTIFKLSPDGVETVLHAFTGGTDGGNPYAGLLAIGDTLYGTAIDGGNECIPVGCGTVFKLKEQD